MEPCHWCGKEGPSVSEEDQGGFTLPMCWECKQNFQRERDERNLTYAEDWYYHTRGENLK